MMLNKIKLLLFCNILIFSSCLTDLERINDYITLKEFTGVVNYLQEIDTDDNRYKDLDSLKILSISDLKWKYLKELDENEKFQHMWDKTYFSYSQKPKYLKMDVSGDSYVSFGTGQCVDAIFCLTNLKVLTSTWIKGEQASEATITPGTVICTFDKNGKYSGHAAIFKSKHDDGIEVFDQNWWSTDINGRIIPWTKNIFGSHLITGKEGINNPNNQFNYFVVKIK